MLTNLLRSIPAPADLLYFRAALACLLRRCTTVALIVLSLVLGLGLTAAGAAGPSPQRVTLRFDPQLVLEWVAHEMNVTLRPEIPVPEIRLESRTPLRRFQQAIAAQWHFQPPMITNAYAVATNEIYLIDDASYYQRRKTTIDDSLAHEFAHYIQVHYQNASLTDETCEQEAVTVQLSFGAGHPPAPALGAAG